MFRFLFILIIAFPLVGWAGEQPHILVSIAPYKKILEELIGEPAEVTVLVPPGASAHTYEPSPRHIAKASRADIWFLVGESFETKAARSIKGAHPEIVLVDLREGVDLLPSSEGQCCGVHRHGMDPHFWLSPRRVAGQVESMATELSRLYPERRAGIEARAARLESSLRELDRELGAIFANSSKKTLFVSHPAYGYLAHDYGFEQVSIEFEGKDPTPQRVTELLQRGRREKIQTIYLQPQHSTKGAELIAKYLGASVVVLDPYGEDYFFNLRHIAKELADPAEGKESAHAHP